MEERRRGGERNNGQITEAVDDEEQVDAEETDGEGTGVCDRVPVTRRRREDGGESRDVGIPMQDLTGGEGEALEEDVVNQELQKRLFVRRICPTVLAQLVTTAIVVLAVNYGLETVIHENLFATLVCGIIAVALICVVCVCCALRLATTWPWCIVYLILLSLSFGIIFGVICVVYAEGDSFLVAAGFSCGLILAANLAFYWLATGVYFVNPNGWLFSFGDASLPDHWAPVALSIYLDFALIFVLSLMVLGVRHEDDQI